MNKKTLQDILEEGTSRLVKVSIEEAKLDAWYLFSKSFCINKVKFLLNKNAIASEEAIEKFFSDIKKREKHIPLQYILEEQEFMGFSFSVNRHVLVPRQDTEVLVEEVAKIAKGKSILDIGTGSGCIIISLAKLQKLKKAAGADISKEALETAKKNNEKNGTCVHWIQSNLFENIKEKYDIIVSNPPYIKSQQIETLMPEVKDYEPLLALDGGEDGLYFYRNIISNGKKYLEENGKVFFEIGCEQKEAVSQLFKEHGFTSIKTIKDLAGLDRVVSARLP